MPTNKAKSPVAIVPLDPDLQRLHDTAAFHAATVRELNLIKSRLEHEFHAMIGRHREEIVILQQNVETTLATIEEIARQHPEWFAAKKELKTPFGTIKFRATSRLEIADENATLASLFRRAERVGDFDPTLYFREKITLDREALEKLPAAVLKRLGIVPVSDDQFSFKLTSIELERALTESVPPQEAAAA